MKSTQQIQSFLFGILFAIIPFSYSFSQNVVLTTQAEVDDFDPSITSINEDLVIEETAISNLDNLSNLTYVRGNVRILGNPSLQNINGLVNLTSIGGSLNIGGNALLNLNGLDNLTSIGENLSISSDVMLNLNGLESLTLVEGTIYITYNSALQNLDGLDNLTTVKGGLDIAHNYALQNIDALANLISVERDYLQIVNNDQLANLDGLINLTTVDYLVIYLNDGLVNIEGLANLTYAESVSISSNSIISSLNGLENLMYTRYIFVQNNNSLTDCCAIQNILSNPEDHGLVNINITNNPSECSTEEEILTLCGLLFDVLATPPCINLNNGTIEVAVTSLPMLPFSYTWTRIEDGQTGSGVSNDINFTIEDLQEGTYDLIVVDTNGDTDTQNGIVLNADPEPIFKIVETTTVGNTSLYFPNGNITITVEGGVPPYNYSWWGASVGVAANVNESTYSIESLSQGTLFITVSDDAGHSQNLSLLVLEELLLPSCTPIVDVVVLNDVSGSINNFAYMASKTGFIDLINSLNIGSGIMDSRAAIIEWAGEDEQSVQIEMSDNLVTLQDYLNYDRAFEGGATALQSALEFGKNYLATNARPNAEQMLFLFTDANSSQISPDFLALVDQYRADGYHIFSPIFIDPDAETQTPLNQISYSYIPFNNDYLETSIAQYFCPISLGTSVTTYYDRDGIIDVLNIETYGNCPLVDSIEIYFTVSASEQLSIPSGTPITFYNNDPAFPDATPLLTWEIPCPIPPYTTETFSLVIPLTEIQTVYAVLNDDESQSPIGSFPITNINEVNYANNIDSQSVCIDSFPTLQVFKYTNTPIPICNNIVTYTIDVCNISGLDAIDVQVTDVPPFDFVLIDTTTNFNACSNQNGNGFDIPVGCCVSITYTYDVTNAPNGIYNDQDVLLSGPNDQTYIDFDGADTLVENVTIDGTIDCPSTIVNFTKSVDTTEICEYETITYTFTIDNQLNIPLEGLIFTDYLPNYAEWTSAPFDLNGLIIDTNIVVAGSSSFTIDYIEADTIASFSMDATIGDWEFDDGILENSAILSNVPDLENGGFQTLYSDTVFTNIVNSPEIIVFASVLQVNSDEEIQLYAGIISGSGDVDLLWTSSGDGIFSDPFSGSPIYTPGTQDWLNGGVSLTVTSNSECGSDEEQIELIIIPSYDWGDNPDQYNTTNSTDGARHFLQYDKLNDFYLGSNYGDGDIDGMVGINADGDDTNGIDDEDGILVFPTLTSDMTTYTLNINVTNNQTVEQGYLHAWIDFNRNGIFEIPEYFSSIVAPETVGEDISLNFNSSSITEGITYARFRITSDTLLDNGATIIDERSKGFAANGEVEDYFLEIMPPPCQNLVAEIQATFISCYQANDATIEFTNPLGGALPYTYSIDGINFTNQTLYNLLPPGNYTAIIQDNNGCLFEKFVNIEEAVVLTTNIGLTMSISCNGAADATATIITNGGMSPFTYIWNNGEMNATATNLAAGEYMVSVTDANSCMATNSITINEPDLITFNLISNNSSCFGGNNGSIRFDEVLGGAAPFSYSIDGLNFSSQTQFDNLSFGDYALAIEDDAGCIYEELISIGESEELILNLGLDTIIPLGESLLITPQHNLIVVDTFIWMGVECINCPEVTLAPTDALTISLTIADLNGCLASDDISIGVNSNTELFVPNVFSPNNDGINDLLYPQAADGVLTIQEFVIVNRWGARVFAKHDFAPNDPAYGWGGTLKGQLLQPGVFAWYAKTTLLNGEEKLFKGDVVVVR